MVKVRLRFVGILQQYTGASDIELEMEDGATLRNVFGEIGKRWGDRFPPEFWDREGSVFSERITVQSDKRPIKDLELRMEDGECLVVVLPLAGGY